MSFGDAYEQLRDIVSERTRRFVIWCGAGLSTPAGLPTWQLLQRKLESALQDKNESISDDQSIQREQRLRSIKQEKNPWVAFQRLQKELGATSFRESIRQSLSRAASVEVPEAYLSLWKMRPSGFITLNLDRLATKAFNQNGNNSTLLTEFKGKDIASHMHVLSGPRSFVCNLHGIEEDYDSWVFTSSALKEISEKEDYSLFVNSILTGNAVIFVGITADDVAVGGHLQRLSSFKISSAPHFWITDRRDGVTDQWAESSGIRVIRYSAKDNHAQLKVLLEDLASHVPVDPEPAPPVTLPIEFPQISFPSPDKLETLSPEELRNNLNSYASGIISSESSSWTEKYEEFSKRYDRYIHNSWYTSTEPPNNQFLGYTLISEIARGAFGIVFRALDKSGGDFAIKLLHSEVRRKPELLNAFRRGARSMKILEQAGVQGVVRYRGATEIPATLIMEWVEGSNLAQIVESRTLRDWDKVLEIGRQLTNVIASAHALPERVMHRDIRPANIMICGYWEGDELEVKVLDFDLSWHRGSAEKSVIFGSALVGYLAPEQVQPRKNVSTQHASVDSYGIGMTLFFMVSGRDPSPGEHQSMDWSQTIKDVVKNLNGCAWKSLPARMGRLIYFSTRDAQSARWDVTQILGELERLDVVLRGQHVGLAAELVAEEIVSRTKLMTEYIWDDARLTAVMDFHTGLRVEVSGSNSNNEVGLLLERTAGESDNRVSLGDSIQKTSEAVSTILRSGGWGSRTDIGKGVLRVFSSIESSSAQAHLDQLARCLDKAIEKMNFY